MERKEIIIFFLGVIVTCWVLRKIFVFRWQKLKNVVYKSDNLIITKLKEGNGKRLVILGSGFSLSIDEQNRIIKHDPFMVNSNLRRYSRNTTVMSIFYPFESQGLEQAGKELSDFINSDCNKYSDISLIGHSKCGVCFANMAKWIKRQVNIVTISASFSGTPVVEKKKMRERLNLIDKVLYNFLFSNHNVDQDLVTNSVFMKSADYTGLKSHYWINIVASCPKISANPIDMFLIHIDKNAKVQGDGIAPRRSQLAISLPCRKFEISATHATSMREGVRILKNYCLNL